MELGKIIDDNSDDDNDNINSNNSKNGEALSKGGILEKVISSTLAAVSTVLLFTTFIDSNKCTAILP